MAKTSTVHAWIICYIFLAAILGITVSQKCPPLPFASLSNGEVVRTSSSRFRFQCHEGYLLSGLSEIRCYKGNWTTDRAPLCYKSGTCAPAPEIPNGDVYGSIENQAGSVAHYVCHPGHIILGSDMRTCLETGYWSGITPACMNESEPLQDVANRLGREFITKMGSHSANASGQIAYYLDKASLKRGLDLVILVDRSSSVDPYDLNTGKEFIKFLFREFGIKNGNNANGSRAAVVAFGTKVDVLININDSSIDSPETAGNALDERLLPNGGGTAMVPAMIAVLLEVIPFIRNDAKLALFMISDGEPNVGSSEISPKEMAETLASDFGFEIFSVGIGPDINRQLLASISSEPVLNHVFILKKYSDLGKMMTIIQNKPPEARPIRPEKCGYIAAEDEDKLWPWIASVYVSRETGNATSLKMCAGVLFCSQWVLTSASCFFNVNRRDVSLNLKEVFVVLGEDDLLKVDANQTNFYAIEVKIHPDFDPFSDLTNNVALIKLNKPAPVRPYRPTCLPPTDGVVPLHLNKEINATVSGWGTSPINNDGFTVPTTIPRFKLAVRQVIIEEGEECLQSKTTEDMSIFCTISGSEDSCVGIHGSPVIAQEPRTRIYHVLGILSRKENCRQGYSQYVELRKYVPWINEETDRCHLSHWN